MLLRTAFVLFLAAISLLTATTAAACPQGDDFSKVIDGALDSVYMLGVVRRSETGPEVFQFIGTGWVIAEGKLATNAHVAEALLESSFSGRLVAKRSWSDRDELALSATTMRIHPAYGPWNARLKRVVVRSEGDPSAARSINFIPVADVAIVEVEAGNTAKPLVIADMKKVEPFLSEPVVYLGFPHENISGFPTLHAVPGHITAKTDFFFLRAPWAESFLIHYCGAVVGGASGSPMLNRAGQVIGLISAGENTLSANGERTSFGFAYGQRVDLCAELLRDDYEEVQQQRDGVWSERIASLLIPPEELLEQLASSQARADGIARLENANTVTRREVIVKQDAPATLQVTLEPGMRYGFLAAAHDGTDVDSNLVMRDGDVMLAQDFQTDYFPVLWVGPFDERTAVTFNLSAAERLLRDTACSVQVYKYEPQLVVDSPSDSLERTGFLAVDHVVESDHGYMTAWQFQVEEGTSMWLAATSPDSFDIDLIALLDGSVVASDEMTDAVPMIMYVAPTRGVLELRLRIPAGATPGAIVQMNCVCIDGAQPILISGGSAASNGGPAPQQIDDAQMQRLAESVASTAWGVLADKRALVTEGFLDSFETNYDFNVELDVGESILMVAVSADGRDIDAIILQGEEVVVSNTESDSTPYVIAENAGDALTLVYRLREYNTEGPSARIYYRFEVVHHN